MDLELDIEKYDEYQEAFIEEITKTILTKLVEAGMEGEKLEETTANLVFSLASIIDDTTAIEADGAEVKPYLTFRTGDNELLHCGENSYTYEFVRIVLKKLLDV
jgi:hypothetical protein